LSGDEIIFGEMLVREPERRLRPDSDRRLAALAYEVPGPADLPIFLDHRAADAIERHALSDTTVELGGILLGKECLDQATGQPFVWITQSLEAKHYANTQASFTYTHDTWEEITRQRDERFPDSDIVGWYHTHPSFGIFLSHHDLFIHQNFFARPLQVAYVIDPINQTRGFFQWREGRMEQVTGYYLTAERGNRIGLARLVNDLEQLPNPEGNSGGILSPRLEAELIKMLTRPAHREVASSVDKVQLAGVFGLLGALVGVLAVAAALWLHQLHLRLQAQTESLQTLAGLVEQSATSQRLMSDTLVDKVKTESPAEFVARYDRAAKARDEAVKQIEIQRAINDALARRAKDLEDREVKLAAELTSATKELDRVEKKAKEIPELRDQITALDDLAKRQQRKLDVFGPWLETEEGKRAEAIERDLVHMRHAAYAGWFLSVLFGLGLVAGYFYLRAAPALTESAPDALPDVDDRPTHRIE
jgi:proteasome lid subunit RPN8/RPN11